jgi:Xaa-Pro aminopeptidase
MNEREISSLFEFLCKVEGAQRMPYPQVVAGGNNACTIHYSNNNKKVFEGEMVLMDAGCDFHGYVSDITRTWPIGGKFTEPQREVYEHVLEAHQKCLELCVEGATLRDIHKTSVTLLSRALSKLGIVQKSTRDVIMQGLYKPYYPHSIGHWLGMDTHDVHTVSAIKPFEVGTVLTVEPGLYLPRNNQEIPAQYRGIGIRLEDDILVTSDGPDVLSGALPIKCEDVEAIVGKYQEEDQQQSSSLEEGNPPGTTNRTAASSNRGGAALGTLSSTYNNKKN